MPTPEEQEFWDAQHQALKENLKAQIDRMLVTDVEYNDVDVTDKSRAPTMTIKGFWLNS